MDTSVDDETLRCLLALRDAARGQEAELARALRAAGSPWPVLAEGRWLAASRSWWRASRQLEAIRQLGISVVPAWSLPAWARNLRSPPILLCVRGEPGLLARRGVAMVGARCSGPGAQAWARTAAARLAAAGELIISGGARGIDAAAHLGAASRGKPTLAFSGTAVDRTHSLAQRELLQGILWAGGAWVSEHPPHCETQAYHFTARNRLIAAQARALWVVQAGEKSGTLGTAAWAHRLKVPIWVAPAVVGPHRQGLELLLQRGWARPLPLASGPAATDKQAAGDENGRIAQR